VPVIASGDRSRWDHVAGPAGTWPGPLAYDLGTVGFQPKLRTDRSGDVYEREADEVADRVMRSDPQGGECCSDWAGGSGCSGGVQRQTTPAGSLAHGSEISSATESRIRSGDSAGQLLPGPTRAFFEPRFGRDLSDVRVHTGPDAVQLNEDLQAHAFTHGAHIWLGLGQSPEPSRVLAHELAHVVQQARPTAAASTTHVVRAKAKEEGHKPTPQEESDDTTALSIAADIVQNDTPRQLAGAPPRYAAALRDLYAAKHGRIYPGKDYTGAQRLEALDRALAGLRPAITMMQHDRGQAEWLDGEFTSYLQPIREAALVQQARDRVEGSVTIDGKTVEIPDDEHPREQAALLKSYLPKLIDTISQINELAIRLGHDPIHHAAMEMFKGEGRHAKGFGKWAGNLVELQNVLLFAQGVLTLTDKEFQHELHHIQGVLGGIATYTELVKACVELTGGGVALSASYAAVIAKAVGDESAMLAAQGVARTTGLLLANVVAGIEIVWGIVVLVDPHASSEKKEHAVLAVAGGGAWFIGRALAGSLGGGIAALGVALTYLELKWLASEYWGAVIGLDAAWLRGCFEHMQGSAETIIRHGDAMHRAHDLMVAEKHPEQAAALQKAEHVEGALLQHSLDEFLETCTSGSVQEPWRPGGWQTLRGKFAPLMHFRSARTTEETVEGAKQTLDAIIWCLKHAGDIVLAEAKQMNIGQLEAYEKKKEGGGQSEE
jgi:hypothetical protein